MTKTKGRVFLIDGSATFYRAYFAFIRNPLINSKGENTSATFGFVNSLLKLIRDEKPDYIAVVFDTKEPTFRHERYPEYKSTRAKMPDDLVEQIPRIHQAVKALNIASYEQVGYEADDIIGTFAKRAARDGHEVWCVTGDKDFYQLVDDKIGIYTPGRGADQPTLYKREEVKEKFGVYPELVIDKLALMGDTSDNVPGIPGVGAKTADKLLEEFGSLEEVLANSDQIKAKGLRTKVTDNKKLALLSKELVTIDTEVPMDLDYSEIAYQDPDLEAAKKLFLELEFTNLYKQLQALSTDGAGSESGEESDEESDADSRPVQYTTISTLKDLTSLVKELSQAKEIAFDTETTSLDPLEAELVGVSLSDRGGRAWYIPLGHTTDENENCPFDSGLKQLKKLLEDPKVQKAGQNLKYDYQIMRKYGVEVSPISFDTMLASYVLNPSDRRHSLDYLALKHFDYQMQPITDLIGSGKKQLSFSTVPVKKATFYAAEDADFTFRLRGVLAPQIHQLKIEDLYYKIEMPLVGVLARMELEGIRVDADYLGELSVEMEARLKEVEAEIYGIAGGEFNINSTQQLSHILFDKLRLPTKGKTAKKTGYSTDVKVLEELAPLHPFPDLILRYRQLTKLKSTYIDAIPKLISPVTGRVHTSFNQAVATTGRLSSTDPNLQNIPIRTEEGRQIRKAFIARDDDHLLLAADYSQVELRILAHYCGDKSLIEAFKKGEDIHTRTAAEVYGVKSDKVTPAMRRTAKTTNFAVVYGVTPYGLSQQTEMSVDEAKQFIDTYFERYPGIRKYIDETKASASKDGYVSTMFNRRRYLPEINSKNRNVRQFAERTAINTPIQGTAADIIKRAMITIDAALAKMKTRMVLQVHDELVLDVHRSELDATKKIVRDGMQKAAKLKVPLVADMGIGDNWLDTK